MLLKRFLPRVHQIYSQFQVRSFVRAPFANKLTHYLRRAQHIDSIRLALRSNSPDTLSCLLNDRLVDPFIVTHALRSAPNADSALSIVHTLMSNDRFSHTQTTLHALATVLAKCGRTDQLNSLLGEIRAGRFGNVKVSFMNLMQWYNASGDLELVLSTWDEYRRQSETRVCTESYNVVMSVYVNRGMHFQAVETFRRMIDEGAIPNSRTYTVMIEHLLSVGKLDEGMEVFRMLPLMRIKRTSKQYLILVEGFVGVKRFDVVKDLLNEMRDDGKFPGRAMRFCLLQMKEAGFVDETDEFLREMIPDERIKNVAYGADGSDDEDGEEVDDDGDGIVEGVQLKPWLDPKSLANALNEWGPEVIFELEDAKFVWTNRLVCKVLRNFSSVESAWQFFSWVAYQPGYVHDIYSVERMMAILARHGHIDLVDRLISKVRKEGMKLPFSTIRLIIDFYGISKKADAALKVFHEDRTLGGPISKFNMMILYSSLLRTLTKCNRNSDAIYVLEEMVIEGVFPDIQTFSGLMYHFALQGDIKTVQKLFTMVRQTGVELDAYMLKVLIQAYCKCERAALAYRVFEDMANSNLLPDAATKELLVKSLWKEGKRKEAAIVEERCEEMTDILPLALRGHIWTISSADLSRVYNIYSNSFTPTCA